MYIIYRTIGDHRFQITLSHGMGGEQEDVSLWCQKCDSNGSNTWTYDLRKMSLLSAIREINIEATAHAGG